MEFDTTTILVELIVVIAAVVVVAYCAYQQLSDIKKNEEAGGADDDAGVGNAAHAAAPENAPRGGVRQRRVFGRRQVDAHAHGRERAGHGAAVHGQVAGEAERPAPGADGAAQVQDGSATGAEALGHPGEDAFDRAERLAEEAAAAEYQAWRGAITVQDQGSVDEESERQAHKLSQFVETIQTRKVVVLEQLAAEFDMRTTDVLQRIQELEKAGRISGVLDDRGKYVYLTPSDLEKVAAWVNEKGRFTKSELAAAVRDILT